MRKVFVLLGVFLILILVVVILPSSRQVLKNFISSKSHNELTADWQAVEKVFGMKGSVQDDVFRINFPRSDLQVRVDGVTIEPGLALTSWIAFKKESKNQAMIMGDLVLLEREVDPVISKLTTNGIDITALHNHLTKETPKIMFLHYSGQGDPVVLAEIMKDALASTNTSLTPSPERPAPAVDWSKAQSILGWTGQSKGNLLQLSVPRKETITENGMELPPIMGTAQSINFQAVGNKVATAGDFVLIADEVNLVVRSLTENGISVTAIHNHMLYEKPRLFYLHFWGYGDQEKLAIGLKAALDNTNSVKK